MKIGITCYPTYGGSGVVATELGLELAQRGHEIHFISYAQPIRLRGRRTEHSLPRSRSVALSAVRLPALRSGAGHAHGRSCAVIRPRPAARALRDSAFGKRAAGAPDAGRWSPRTPTALRHNIARNRHHAGRSRPFLLPITRYSIEQSDGVTAISNYLRDRTMRVFDVKNPIEVIYNSVNCDVYTQKPESRGDARRICAQRRALAGASFEFPSGKAASPM